MGLFGRQLASSVCGTESRQILRHYFGNDLLANDEAIDLVDGHLCFRAFGFGAVHCETVAFKHPLGGRRQPISDERFVRLDRVPNINHVPPCLPYYPDVHHKPCRRVVAYAHLNLDLVR
jgi:hypothetical protein